MGRTFVDNETMKPAGSAHRQCADEQGHCLVFCAMGTIRDRLGTTHLDLLILPILRLHLLAPCRAHLQCCGWIP